MIWLGQAGGLASGGGTAGGGAPEGCLLRLCCQCPCSMVGEAWWQLLWLEVQSQGGEHPLAAAKSAGPAYQQTRQVPTSLPWRRALGF